VGVFDATQTVTVMREQGMHHYWTRLFVVTLVSWLPWAVVTPGILFLGRRFPPTRFRPIATWAFHLTACALAAVFHSAVSAELRLLFNPLANSPAPGPFTAVWSYSLYGSMLSYLFLYGAILAIGYVIDSREKLARQQTETARLNEQLSKAQLDALRRQIEPHFLFNTLNAVAGLVREKRNDAAVSMIAGLSDFLRRAVKDSGRQQVPLGEEMEFLQKYLDIQKVRFADRLQLSVDVPPDLFPAQVPCLILQPMVENAVKHGIAKRAQGGAIRISASRSNGTLRLQVYNDGPQLPEGWETPGSGIGIANVRTRLQSLYGSGFDFTIRNEAPHGVQVSLSVPFVTMPTLKD